MKKGEECEGHEVGILCLPMNSVEEIRPVLRLGELMTWVPSKMTSASYSIASWVYDRRFIRYRRGESAVLRTKGSPSSTHRSFGDR